MKRLIPTMIVTCLAFGNVAMSADQFQLRGSGLYYAPGGAAASGSDASALKEVEWDKGTGFEIQGIFWPANSLWGFGASIGKATWDISDYADVRLGPGGFTYGDFLEGDADLTILGASVFRQLFSEYGASKKLSGAIEGGIRFVSVDSNIDGFSGIGDEIGPELGGPQTLEFDDGIVGLVALSLDYAVTETVGLFAQGGVQFDLDKGSVENDVPGLGTFEAGEMELQAVFGKVGASISL